MRRALALGAGLATGLALLLLSALPAAGADSGTVTATITAAPTCILVTPETVDLGSANFSALLLITRAIPTQVESCSTASQTIFARGTDATGAGGVQWNLAQIQIYAPNHCQNVQANMFFLRSPDHPNDGIPRHDLADGQDSAVAILGPGTTMTDPTVLVMPCTGSDGAGVPMTFTITFTATQFSVP
jgi:hypothetical protein